MHEIVGRLINEILRWENGNERHLSIRINPNRVGVVFPLVPVPLGPEREVNPSDQRPKVEDRHPIGRDGIRRCRQYSLGGLIPRVRVPSQGKGKNGQEKKKGQNGQKSFVPFESSHDSPPYWDMIADFASKSHDRFLRGFEVRTEESSIN